MTEADVLARNRAIARESRATRHELTGASSGRRKWLTARETDCLVARQEEAEAAEAARFRRAFPLEAYLYTPAQLRRFGYR